MQHPEPPTSPDKSQDRHHSQNQEPSKPPSNHSSDLAEKAVEFPEDEADEDVSAARSIHGWKWVLTVASLYSFALLYGLDTTIAADVQPAIVTTFGSVQKLAWIGAGFPLGSVATILPIGYAYGLFDLKKFIVISIVVFETGSAVCGAAPTMDTLIVGRVIAGAGGAGMYLGALNFVGAFTTLKERSLYNAMIGMIWGLGTILGPIVGGLFAEKATWRWAFYINLVLAAIFGPILLYMSPTRQPRPEMSFWRKLKEIDWLGSALFAAAFVAYVIAFTFGGATWKWSDGRFIATTTLCGVVLAAFILTQYFSVFTRNRIFPVHFLRSRTMILLFICTATSATGMVVGAYFIPLYFQFVHQDGALEAAVRLLPFIIVLIVCIMLNGATLPSVGYYFPWYIASGVLLAVGGGLMYTLGVETSVSKVYGYSVLVAAGAGLVGQAGYVITQAKVPAGEIAAAISFQNVAQTGGIVFALTIAGSIFQNEAIRRLVIALSQYGFSIDQIKTAVAGTQSVIFERGSLEVKALALKALIDGMDQVFLMLVAAGGLNVIIGLLMKKERVLLPKVQL